MEELTTLPSCLVHWILGDTTRCGTVLTEQVRRKSCPIVRLLPLSDIVTTGAGTAVWFTEAMNTFHAMENTTSPFTVMEISSLLVAVVPPVTVPVHVYVPSSWSARGLIESASVATTVRHSHNRRDSGSPLWDFAPVNHDMLTIVHTRVQCPSTCESEASTSIQSTSVV